MKHSFVYVSPTFAGKFSADGELVADHRQVPASDSAIVDEHYPTGRKPPSRAPRARSKAETAFLALGPAAEQFICDGAAAGITSLPKQIIEIISDLVPAHGETAVRAAIQRAVTFGRYRAADIRSILNTNNAVIRIQPAGGDLPDTGLPQAHIRSFDA